MYNLIKRNLDVNLEQSASLESFNDFINILSAKRLAQSTSLSQDEAATKSEEKPNESAAASVDPAALELIE